MYTLKFKSKFSWDCASECFILNDLCVSVAENWNAVKFACGIWNIRRCFISNSYKNIIVAYTLWGKFLFFFSRLIVEWIFVGWSVVKINQKTTLDISVATNTWACWSAEWIVGGFHRNITEREKVTASKVFHHCFIRASFGEVVTGECGSVEKSRNFISSQLVHLPSNS